MSEQEYMEDRFDLAGIKVRTQVTYTIGNNRYFSPLGACRRIAKSRIWGKKRLSDRLKNSWGETGCTRFGCGANDSQSSKCTAENCDRCFYLKLRERYTKLLLRAYKLKEQPHS